MWWSVIGCPSRLHISCFITPFSVELYLMCVCMLVSDCYFTILSTHVYSMHTFILPLLRYIPVWSLMLAASLSTALTAYSVWVFASLLHHRRFFFVLSAFDGVMVCSYWSPAWIQLMTIEVYFFCNQTLHSSIELKRLYNLFKVRDKLKGVGSLSIALLIGTCWENLSR